MTVTAAATNFYLNGAASSAGSGITNGSNIEPLLIGTSYSTPCDTELDEVQIFSRALLQSEILAIYNAGSAGKCKCEPNINKCPGGPEGISLAGIADDFAPSPVDPLPNAVGCTPPNSPFDATVFNQDFCHTFTGLPSGIKAATLEIRLRNLGNGNPCNDTLSLQSGGAGSWSRFIGTDNACVSPTNTVGLLPYPWVTLDDKQTFCLDLAALPQAVGPALDLLAQGLNGSLRVSVQDDTAVDYVRLHYYRCTGGCGPDPHWIDSCPGGTDLLDGTAVYVSIDTDFDAGCLPELAVMVTGDAVVDRDPGITFPLPHHMDTEMVSMTAIGGGLTLTVGAGLGLGPLGGSLAASSGTIVEKGDASKGLSTFNVFFEIDRSGVGTGPFLYNQTPCVMEGQLTKVPPKVAIYTRLPGCLPLYASPIPGGQPVARLGAAWHCVGCDPTPGACCRASDNHCDYIPELACEELGKGYVFRGSGTVCGVDDTCIPTLSEWGVAVMAILVLTAGTIVVMRRRAATAA